MNDKDIYGQFICPVSGDKLSYSDSRDIIDKVHSGDLGLYCGESLPAAIDGVLQSNSYMYPIINGVPMLVEGYHLVNQNEMLNSENRLEDMVKAQLKQMEKFSEMHKKKYYDQVTEAQQKVLREDYYGMLHGASVLDIGNGGLTAHAQLGAEHADKVSRFFCTG